MVTVTVRERDQKGTVRKQGQGQTECVQAALGLVPRAKRSAAQWVKWEAGQRDGEAHANFCEVLSEEYGRF